MIDIEGGGGAPGGEVAWSPRRIVVATLMVLAIAGAFALLQLAGAVILYFILGLVLAVASEPGVAFLVRRGLPRNAAGLVMLGVVAALGAGAALLLFPMVFRQIAGALDRAPALCRSLRSFAANAPSRLLVDGARQMLSVDCGLGTITGGMRWQYVQSLGDPIWATMAALVGAYAWIVERPTIQLGLLRLVAPERREAGRNLIEEIDGRLGAFVRGQAIMSLIIGALTTVFYLIIGVPGALALGTLAALAEVIPLAGPLVAAGVGVLAAATTHPSLVVAVIAFAAVLRIGSDYLLAPLVMSRSVGVNPFLALLMLVALGSVGGIVGAMVAVPISALVQLGIGRALGREAQLAPPEGRDAVSFLRYRATALAMAARRLGRRRAATGRDCTAEDEAETLAVRLADLLGESDVASPPPSGPIVGPIPGPMVGAGGPGSPRPMSPEAARPI